MKWSAVPNPNCVGFCARAGNRYVEILKAYEGQWFWFATIGGAICKGKEEYMSYFDALAWGRSFLAGEITPECHPIKP